MGETDITIHTTFSLYTYLFLDIEVVSMVLEKTLESPLDCKEIKPVNRNGNQS